ncbi:MAG: phage tail family protein [Clostridiales bacterium]|jgi:phage-related protein|nr:phage tail family protein [Clostridiales bacterium]
MLVSKEVVLTYTNAAGASLSMAFFQPFFLLGCTEKLQNNISSEKGVNRNGEILTNMGADARNIEITGYINAASGRRAMEGTLKSVFNIGAPGTLEYYNTKELKRYRIACYAEAVPDVVFTNMRTDFTINLKCLDPYWYGEELALAVPQYSLTFNNAGDSPAGVVFEIIGSAVSPKVSNAKGESLCFMNTLASQTLRITSMPENAYVELDGAGAMQYLTDAVNRRFFMLDIGQNTISYGADSGASGLSVTIKYRPRYLGAF